MDFEIFSITRDLLCLTGTFVGTALGYFWSLCRKDITLRSRNRRITLVLLFFSGALIAFSTAIIVSRGAIFGAGSLFAVAGAGVPVFALAVRFPRAAAFPLILVGGLLIVWLGHSYLRFPLIKSSSVPLISIYNDGGGSYSIKFPTSYGDRAVRLSVGTERLPPLPISESLSSLAFQGTRIGFGELYPIIGGTARGAIGTIHRDGGILYTDPFLEGSLLRAYYSRLASIFHQGPFAVHFQSVKGAPPINSIPEGANLSIFFDRDTLSFNPSWESRR
ncbi:MAG: hypothetical protein LBN21_06335 [Treponema sp.]|jgi:hypothetical protein|nr:hypothetical protein [Treponema sp.]